MLPNTTPSRSKILMQLQLRIQVTASGQYCQFHTRNTNPPQNSQQTKEFNLEDLKMNELIPHSVVQTTKLTNFIYCSKQFMLTSYK
jgi:hypothetical protein